VNLLGIDSPRTTKSERLEIWRRLAVDLPLDKLDSMIDVVPLGKVFEAGENILAGKIRGRTVIDINGA